MKQHKTIQLQLKPEIEAWVIRRATKQGLSIESYLESLIEDSLKNKEEKSFSQVTTEEDWETALMNLINSPAFALAPPLSDAAISRDSIYTREDNLIKSSIKMLNCLLIYPQKNRLQQNKMDEK